MKNCWSVALLLICNRNFERLIYDTLFSHLENNILSENKSGFRRGDSYINQVFDIAHGLCSSCDENYEVRGVFLFFRVIFI